MKNERFRLLGKMTAVLIALLLVFTAFSGCSPASEDTSDSSDDGDKVAEDNGDKEEDPLDKSEYWEIKILRTLADPKFEQYADENYFRQVLKEKFNFGFEVISVPGDILEKLSVMLSAGDYPALVGCKNENLLKAYVEAGALVNLEPLIEKYGPNFKERHKERIPYWKVMSGMDDGNIWFYTTVEPNMSYGVSGLLNEWILRSDIVEQQGYPKVQNEDDIFRIVKKGLEDNPTTNGQPTAGFATPLRDPNSIKCASFFFDMGRNSHMTRKYGSIWDTSAEKFIDVAKDYAYYDGLRFYNKMWRNGLVDKDAVTYSSNMFKQKFGTGYCLSTFFYCWPRSGWNETLRQNGENYRFVQFAGQLKSMHEKGEKKIYPITNGEIWSSQSITKNCKHPERLMEILNWCATKEGLVAAGWGEEGEQYTVNDEGLRIPTEEHMEKMQSDPDYKYTWLGASEFGLFAGLDENGQNFRMTSDEEYTKSMIDPKQYDVWSHYGWDGVYEMQNENDYFEAAYDYPLGFTMVIPGYNDDEKKDFEKMFSKTHEYTVKMITAESVEKFDQLYEELLAMREDFGIDQLIEKRQQKYEELKSKLK